MKETILITGAGGFVGSTMIERFFKEGKFVVGTYYNPTTNIEELPKKIPMYKIDIRDTKSIAKIIAKYKPTKIYHLAAQSYPVESWKNPRYTMDVNVTGTINVFEGVRKCKEIDKSYDPVVIVACSSAEYGSAFYSNDISENGISENTMLAPLHPYGVSKVSQDLLSYQYWMNDKIRCIRARIFNTTGPKKHGDVASDLIYRIVKCIELGKCDKLHVGNLDAKRAIMDVEDLINALVLLSDHGIPGEVYNISSKNVYSIREIVSILEKINNTKYNLFVDNKLIRSTDEKTIVGDTTKLRCITNWKQIKSIEDTLTRMLEYERTH